MIRRQRQSSFEEHFDLKGYLYELRMYAICHGKLDKYRSTDAFAISKEYAILTDELTRA